MQCAQVWELLHLHADGELDSLTTMELDRHFTNCRRCAAARDGLGALREAVRADVLYERASVSLLARIESSLDQAAGVHRPRAPHVWGWLSMAAVLLLVVGLSVTLLVDRSRPTEALAHEVMAGHVRSMMGDHLVDIHSSERHVVKPWFQGKLDFSFDVTDLAAQGFPLVGGRLDYLNGRPVAALVYLRGGHPINVFIWPSPSSRASAPRYQEIQGYRLANWTDHEMIWWAASNVNDAELHQFIEHLRNPK